MIEGGIVGGADGAPPADAVPVGRRLYVNNLSYDTTWASLKDHFRQAGNVLYADVLMVRLHPPPSPWLHTTAC